MEKQESTSIHPWKLIETVKLFLALQCIPALAGIFEDSFTSPLVLFVLPLGPLPLLGAIPAMRHCVVGWDYPVWLALLVYGLPTLILARLVARRWSAVSDYLKLCWSVDKDFHDKSHFGCWLLEYKRVVYRWLACLASYALFIGTMGDKLVYLWLSTTGISVPGMVVSASEFHDPGEPSNSGDGTAASTTHSITVKFKTREGEPVTAEIERGDWLPDRYSFMEGENFPRPVPAMVHYSAKNPQFIALGDFEDFSKWKELLKVACLFILFFGLTIGFCYYYAHSVRDEIVQHLKEKARSEAERQRWMAGRDKSGELS